MSVWNTGGTGRAHLLGLDYGHAEIVGQERRDNVLHFLHASLLELLKSVERRARFASNVFNSRFPFLKGHARSVLDLSLSRLLAGFPNKAGLLPYLNFLQFRRGLHEVNDFLQLLS